MQTESDIFSSRKSPEGKGNLTERLYTSRQQENSFEGLQKLLGAQQETLSKAELEPLECAIHQFREKQSERAQQYLVLRKQPEECLTYLHGFVEPGLTENSRKSSGGLFLRWKGKGIALNPGARFLHQFHAQGLHIRDLDFVIVTHEDYADVKEIYALNYQLNQLSEEQHVIHYYFPQHACQELSGILKPHFKQERHMLHSLELFEDSSEVEKQELASGITLHYFSATKASLGIRLELKSEEGNRSIGYLSHMAWSPLLAHHLGACDLLITGFGNTEPQDYQKLAYSADCLGYYGTATLLEEVAPKLLLCGEFGGREGDIRLELVQKLRSELAERRQAPVILPADTGLCVQLKTLKVRCSLSQTWSEAASIRVVKKERAFGQLAYLSSLYVV